MKPRYSILEESQEQGLLVVNKLTPVYAGESGRQIYPVLEELLQYQYKKNYSLCYPMEYWCSGIVFATLGKNGEILNSLINQEAKYSYDIIVRNPVFFQEEEISQNIRIQGKRYIIHPEGEKFTAKFVLLNKYRDFSYVRVSCHIPFHQGVLVLASYLGSPVVGDSIYGLRQPLLLSMLKKKKYKPKYNEEEVPLIQRPAIHLRQVKTKLGFWEAEEPKDFRAAINNIKKYNSLAEASFLDEWLQNIGEDTGE